MSPSTRGFVLFVGQMHVASPVHACVRRLAWYSTRLRTFGRQDMPQSLPVARGCCVLRLHSSGIGNSLLASPVPLTCTHPRCIAPCAGAYRRSSRSTAPFRRWLGGDLRRVHLAPP